MNEKNEDVFPVIEQVNQPVAGTTIYNVTVLVG